MNIRYGVTKVVSIETIMNFIENNWRVVLEKGYNLSSFIKKSKDS